MVLFRVFRAFLAWFVGFVWVCVVLGVLRGLCGFCARVELGGFGACCVFASIFRFFSVFALLLSLCPCVSVSALLCLSSCLVLSCLVCSCSLVVFVVSFSLSVYTQKERAHRVGASSFRVLWVALSGCGFIFLVLVRCQPVYIVIKF